MNIDEIFKEWFSVAVTAASAYPSWIFEPSVTRNESVTRRVHPENNGTVIKTIDITIAFRLDFFPDPRTEQQKREGVRKNLPSIFSTWNDSARRAAKYFSVIKSESDHHEEEGKVILMFQLGLSDAKP